MIQADRRARRVRKEKWGRRDHRGLKVRRVIRAGRRGPRGRMEMRVPRGPKVPWGRRDRRGFKVRRVIPAALPVRKVPKATTARRDRKVRPAR